MARSKGEISDLVAQLTKKGQWKKALAAMEELYAMDKKDPLVTLRMGDIFLKMGDKDGAATNYIKTAGLFAEKGHIPKAVATYKMVLRVDPSLTGVQDMIDGLTGEADRPKPAFDRKNVTVDLAKEIPGLDDAAMEYPEPVPVKEPDDTPVYEIDTPIPIGSGIIKKFEPKKPEPQAPPVFDTAEAPPAFDLSDTTPEFDTAGTGGYEIDIDAGDGGDIGGAPAFDLSDTTPEFEIADSGAYDLDAVGDDSPPVFDLSDATPEFETADSGGFELDTGRADMDDSSAPDAMPAMTIPGMGDVTGEQALDALDALEVLDGMLVEEHHAEEPGAPGGHGGRQGMALFSDFSQDELWDLFGKMTRHSFKKDEKVVREGEPGSSIFIIKSGSVRVVTRAGAAELLLAHLGEREFFGEVSFLTGKPRTADVIADGPTEIMEFRREDLDEQIKSHPNLERVLKSFYEARVADTLETLKGMPRDFMK